MPDPLSTNMTSAEATRSDLADPSRLGLQITQRVRAQRGDFTDSQPLVLIPSEIPLGTNPTTTDTLVIGGETYEFVTASGTVAADVNIAVAIAGSAALTLVNLLAALNGTAAVAHSNILNSGGNPALGRGTKPVFGEDLGSSKLGLYYTGTQGLDPALMTKDDYAAFPNAYPSFALTDTMTAAVAWTVANFNTLPTANPVTQVHGSVGLRIAVTTALLDVPIRLKFAGGIDIIGCCVSPKSATGLTLYWDAATFLVNGDGELIVDFDTGGAVDPANGQFCDIMVFGQFAGLQA